MQLLMYLWVHPTPILNIFTRFNKFLECTFEFNQILQYSFIPRSNFCSSFYRPFYGYHKKPHHFFKIYFYNPMMIKRAADLLQVSYALYTLHTNIQVLFQIFILLCNVIFFRVDLFLDKFSNHTRLIYHLYCNS
jgi:hypothetical protein